jgi:phage shock protein A
MRKSVKLRFALRCAWADFKRRYVTTPIDKTQQALAGLQQAIASAHARRQEHEKTITDLTARAVSAENALTALTDKVSALTSDVASLS